MMNYLKTIETFKAAKRNIFNKIMSRQSGYISKPRRENDVAKFYFPL